MLRKKDLENQKTFTKYKDTNMYFDDLFDLMIQWEGRGSCIYEHCEVNGNLTFIKTLENFQDLKDTYELYTHKELEI